MALKKTYLPLLVLLIAFVAVANSYADVSDAGVLFLRIPVGARAVGMGEAHVATADDVFALHWNPAGLANPRLSGAWLDFEIPWKYRPVTSVAVFEKGGGDDYQGYEVWAITKAGLVRYDNSDWHQVEVFNTRTDETVSQIVARYFSINDEAELARITERVIEVNSRSPRADIERIQEQILSAIPADYSALQSLEITLDSLLICYDQCRLDWERVADISRRMADGMKDSVLTEVEADRINIAVEKAQKRFIPEELTVPYAAVFSGNLTALASTGEKILVGTDNGLFEYTGRLWRKHTAEGGLPSNNITTLKSTFGHVYIGTDKGVADYNGLSILVPESVDPLPEGTVSAIGAGGSDDIYVSLNNDLYHYDGVTWSNTVPYTVVLDDNAETIVSRFAVYGSAAEKELYRSKQNALAEEAKDDASEAVIEESDTTASAEVIEGGAEELAVADSTATEESGEAPAEIEETIPEAFQAMVASIEDSDQANIVEAAAPEVKTPTVEEMNQLAAGDIIRVPLVAQLKGAISDIHVRDGGVIWLATDYGVFQFDGSQWIDWGYKEHVVGVGETWEDMVSLRSQSDEKFRRQVDRDVRAAEPMANELPADSEATEDTSEVATSDDATEEAATVPEELVQETETVAIEMPVVAYTEQPNAVNYVAFLKEFNDLGDEPLDSGQVIKVYAYPTAYPATSIRSTDGELSFATVGGLINYDGLEWDRSDVKGLGNQAIAAVETRGEQVWFVSDHKIVVNGQGHSEVGFMHAKLVPELADDIYFEYLGFVTKKEGLGSFGLDIKYLTYGKIQRMGQTPGDSLGVFEPYEFAIGVSYGTAITSKFYGGLAARVVHSHLSDIGAASEVGSGIAWSFAVDLGVQYHWTRRFSFGMAIQNLGPDITYVDAAQSDALPRNFAFGLAYKLKDAEHFKVLLAAEANKGLVGLNDSFKKEIQEIIYGAGTEIMFLNLLAVRLGYHYDQEGRQKYVTVGLGLRLRDVFDVDFGINPGDVSNAGAANQPRFSFVFHL